MIGDFTFGEHKETTVMKFKKIQHFDSFDNNIDIDYDAVDKIFTVYLFKINTSEFKRVNRSDGRKRTDFEQDVAEVVVNNCHIATVQVYFVL